MLCPAERPHSSGTCMCAQSRACLLPSLQVHMRLQSPGHPLSKGWSGSWEQIPALGSLPSFPRAFSYPTPQPCQVLRTSGGSRMRVLCGGHRCLVPSWSAPTIFQGKAGSPPIWNCRPSWALRMFALSGLLFIYLFLRFIFVVRQIYREK